MTQAYVVPWTFFVADGVQTIFAFDWFIQAASDLEVYLHGQLVTAYTVQGIQVATGGTVTFLSPPPDGQIVFLRRQTPETQFTDYISNDPFDAQAHEAALDKLTRLVQEVYERISRSPAFQVDAPNAQRDLGFPLPGAGKLIGWSADGTILTLYDQVITALMVPPGTGMLHGVTTVELASVAGAPFLTASAFLPANTILAGVGYRVLTSLSPENGLVSVSLGGLGVENRWGAALGITAGSVNACGQWIAPYVPIPLNASEDALLLANPPTARFGATGRVRLSAFWTRFTPI
jgi:hypothetical protein